MNIVTVLFKTNPQILVFHFDKYADAVKIRKLYLDRELLVSPAFEKKRNEGYDDPATAVQNSDLYAPIPIEDDYGSMAAVNFSEIAAITITDVSREMKAHEEVDCEKHRKDIRVNRTMNAEQPKLAIPQVRQN